MLVFGRFIQDQMFWNQDRYSHQASFGIMGVKFLRHMGLRAVADISIGSLSFLSPR